jgi:hypothetical protein
MFNPRSVLDRSYLSTNLAANLAKLPNLAILGLLTVLTISSSFAAETAAPPAQVENQTEVPIWHEGAEKRQRAYVEERIERYVEIIWKVGTAAHIKPKRLERAERRIRQIGDWSLKHNLPIPTGFTVDADINAGILAAPEVGIEIAFLPKENGDMEMGVFRYGDIEMGAKASVGGSFGATLMYNMTSIDDFEGWACGLNADLKVIEGVGLSLWVGCDQNDYQAFKGSMLGLLRGDEKLLASSLKKFYVENRQFFITGYYGYGIGSSLTFGVGQWHELARTTFAAGFEVEDIRKAFVQLRHDFAANLKEDLRNVKQNTKRKLKATLTQEIPVRFP